MDDYFINIGKKAKEIWLYDSLKKEFANNRGYSVIVLWEDEIKNITDEEIFTLLIKKLVLEIQNENRENRKY
jgi:very-short-patch-repair endonuclease